LLLVSHLSLSRQNKERQKNKKKKKKASFQKKKKKTKQQNTAQQNTAVYILDNIYMHLHVCSFSATHIRNHIVFLTSHSENFFIPFKDHGPSQNSAQRRKKQTNVALHDDQHEEIGDSGFESSDKGFGDLVGESGGGEEVTETFFEIFGGAIGIFDGDG
jgi:hypothetical protein